MVSLDIYPELWKHFSIFHLEARNICLLPHFYSVILEKSGGHLIEKGKIPALWRPNQRGPRTFTPVFSYSPMPNRQVQSPSDCWNPEIWIFLIFTPTRKFGLWPKRPGKFRILGSRKLAWQRVYLNHGEYIFRSFTPGSFEIWISDLGKKKYPKVGKKKLSKTKGQSRTVVIFCKKGLKHGYAFFSVSLVVFLFPMHR